jgi:hypothetical protein
MSNRLQKKAVSQRYIKTKQEKEIRCQPMTTDIFMWERRNELRKGLSLANAWEKIAENENANFGEALADLECQKAPADAMECA